MTLSERAAIEALAIALYESQARWLEPAAGLRPWGDTGADTRYVWRWQAMKLCTEKLPLIEGEVGS